jgi:hypothetical protein
MNRIGWAGTMLAAALFALSSIPARAQEYQAKLSGFQEVGGLNAETGAILSTGEGTLKLTVDKIAKTFTYTLTYSFPSTTNVLQSHIHFGKEHVPGGVVLFFCTNKGNGPSGTQTCPAFAGTVTATVTAADVQAVAGQNVTAGDFDAVVAALSSDSVYANIHTTAFPAGEIRGQVHSVDHDHDGSRDKGDDHGHDKEKGHDH